MIKANVPIDTSAFVKVNKGLDPRDVYGRTILPKNDFANSTTYNNKVTVADLKNKIIYNNTPEEYLNKGIVEQERW